MNLTLQKIQKLDHSFIQNLYELAFPPEERLSFEKLFLREDSRYKMESILFNQQCIGLFFYWDFSSFVYIEHFAVSPHERGGGLGGRILHEFMKRQSAQLILEVETPGTPEAVRRIEFYKRAGLEVQNYPYIQPPYEKGFPEMEMHILSNQVLSPSKFKEVEKMLYTYVYKKIE